MPHHTPEEHAAMKADPKRWAALRFIGYQENIHGGIELELRNCACGGTLAKDVSVHAIIEAAALEAA